MSEQIQRNKIILKKYIPENAIDIIADWIYLFDFKLKIKKERTTKQGDYRSPMPNTNHQITINKNLNSYAFLITLIHEIAHLTTYNNFKNKVKPHGNEWKHEYKRLIQPFFQLNIFPDDVKHALQSYMQNPAASSCTDIHLQRILKNYNPASDKLTIEKMEAETIFEIHNGELFRKGEKVRKRYKCMNIKSKRTYLFDPLYEALIINQTTK